MEIVRHYRNHDFYLVLDRNGYDPDSRLFYVVYKCLITNKYYVRSNNIFNSQVVVDGKTYPRFNTIVNIPCEYNKNTLEGYVLEKISDKKLLLAVRVLEDDSVWVYDITNGKTISVYHGSYNDGVIQPIIISKLELFHHQDKYTTPSYKVNKENW